MKFFLIAIVGVCLWLSLAQAATDSKLKLVGYVRSFDAQNVIVESGNQRFTVPRTIYPDRTKNGELVSIALTKEQFEEMKHAPSVKN